MVYHSIYTMTGTFFFNDFLCKYIIILPRKPVTLASDFFEDLLSFK